MPTFLGVGAAKSGTTALYNFLMQHPGVFMSPIKEPNYFSKDIEPAKFRRDYQLHEKQKRLDIGEYVKGPMDVPQWGAYVREPKHYRGLFRDSAPDQARGEISNSYLYSSVAAAEILAAAPDVRVFMILRNPVDRAFSHYLANIRDGRAILPFREEVANDLDEPHRQWGRAHLYVDLGMYYEQVLRFWETFPESQRRIYLYDDLKRDPGGLVRDLFEFIGVAPDARVDVGRRHNPARVPRSPRLVYAVSALGIKRPLFRLVPRRYREAVKRRFFKEEAAPRMSDQDRHWLTGMFSEDVRRLGGLIGRDLGNWLE
jgi:hypothetical protein